ncbi:MAG: hypothetical protein VR70_06240 [Rhodospirillaceae bacterium BRH_c57]|nr:MAG: hypothetical protein VR70_06240 [Rhodospirillaceae bacterium BRH_c57]
MRGMICSVAAGVLFGSGLIVAGMTSPAKVLGFFDFAGAWDPSLAVVMAVGLFTATVGYRLAQRRVAPCWASSYVLPERTEIDRRLMIGSAIFGLGWGLVGYCPGPALVAGAAGALDAGIFASAMIGGMLVWRMVERTLEIRAVQA